MYSKIIIYAEGSNVKSNATAAPSTMRIHPDGRVDARDAANYLGLGERTLANMRTNGTGPRYVKIGRIFYFLRDLDAWLESKSATSTGEARAKRQEGKLSLVPRK